MLQRGCVVVATAGRDRGQVLAVLEATPDGLWIADGRRRKIQRPKRKNPRHVQDTGRVVSETAMATNRELRRALAGWNQTAQEPDR